MPFNVVDKIGKEPDTLIIRIVTDDGMLTLQSVGEIYDDEYEHDFWNNL